MEKANGSWFLAGIFIMGPFLHIWVGRDLGPEAPYVGRIVLLAMWINALALIPFNQMQAAGRPDLVSKIIMAEVPPYLVMLYAGIHFFGVIGCAVATLLRLKAANLRAAGATRATIARLPPAPVEPRT